MRYVCVVILNFILSALFVCSCSISWCKQLALNQVSMIIKVLPELVRDQSEAETKLPLSRGVWPPEQ